MGQDMRPRRYDAEPPRPSELAAYADGELTGADRQRVEDWLATHPEAAAEIKSLEKLEHLLRTQTPAEPSEAEWANVWQHVEQGLAQGEQVAASGSGRRFWLGIALSAGAAAAVMLALALGSRHGPQVAQQVPEDPFPGMSANDVEITSLNAADVHALAVGELPVRSDVVLVAAGDVSLRSVESDPQWGSPDMHVQQEGNETPMIYAPLLAG